MAESSGIEEMKYLLLALLIFSGCCSTKELNLKVDQIRRSICVKRFNESVFNNRPPTSFFAEMIQVNKEDELGCWIAKWEFPKKEIFYYDGHKKNKIGEIKLLCDYENQK